MLCPNPNKRRLFCLTSTKNLGIFYLEPILYSIFITAAAAPPCLAPERAPVPEAIAVYRSVPDEAMCLTMAVEQLLSSYACIIQRVYSAFIIFVLECNLEPIMYRKFYA